MTRKPDFQRELFDLIDRYLNSDQSIAEKVPSILTQIAIITGTERCVLMIQRGRKHDLDFIHYDSDPEGSLPPSGSFLRSSPKEQLPSSHALSDVFLPDLTEEQDVSQSGEEPDEESWRRIGYSSALRLALSLKGQVAGFLFLLSSAQLGDWFEEGVIHCVGVLGLVLLSDVLKLQAIDSLRKSARFYRSIIDSTPDSVFIKDKSFRFIFSNKTHCERHNRTMNEMRGKTNLDPGFPVEQIFGNPEKGIRGFLNDEKEVLKGNTIHNPFDPVTILGDSMRIFDTYKMPFFFEGNLLGILAFARDITDRHELLQDKTRTLDEISTALKVLWKQREQDERELADNIMLNFEQLVNPYLEKLRSGKLDARQQMFLDIIQANLHNIFSPFARKTTSRHSRLTPTELQVADLIRGGKTNQEIADILCLARGTIMSHRANIRKKLNLRNQKTNLRSFLLNTDSS